MSTNFDSPIEIGFCGATPAMKDEVESATGRVMCAVHEWLDEKPCPYCAEISDYGLPYTVKCPECYAEPGEACYLRLPSTTWRQWPHIMRGELAVKSSAQPSPTLKDEVYAMLNGLHRAGQLEVETLRILWPVLEDAVKWRKR